MLRWCVWRWPIIESCNWIFKLFDLAGIWATIGGQLSGQHHWTTWWATIGGQLGGQQLVVNTKPSGQVSWWQTHNFPGICICICCLSLRQYCLPGGQQLWWYCLQEFEARSSQRGASAGSRLKEKYLTATENFLSMSTSHIFGDKDIQIFKYYQTILSYTLYNKGSLWGPVPLFRHLRCASVFVCYLMCLMTHIWYRPCVFGTFSSFVEWRKYCYFNEILSSICLILRGGDIGMGCCVKWHGGKITQGGRSSLLQNMSL